MPNLHGTFAILPRSCSTNSYRVRREIGLWIDELRKTPERRDFDRQSKEHRAFSERVEARGTGVLHHPASANPPGTATGKCLFFNGSQPAIWPGGSARFPI